ncbi:hypothetical protein [Chelatococcus sp.]|uniref:hypothetical protein n=1 Tax=Chelatococcus sp. TaxID=1953771 RepID=UPI001EC405AD|nr:hypothetical protein [Chelatococcus sp.]MBX3546880.1 hypothetical protein [Chelatococcus sp.]
MSRDSTRLELLAHQDRVFIECDEGDLTLSQTDEHGEEYRIYITRQSVPAFLDAFKAALAEFVKGN